MVRRFARHDGTDEGGGRGGRREAAVWLLAVGSFHVQRSRRFKLPVPLKCALLPLFGVEALLRLLSAHLARNADAGAAPP